MLAILQKHLELCISSCLMLDSEELQSAMVKDKNIFISKFSEDYGNKCKDMTLAWISVGISFYTVCHAVTTPSSCRITQCRYKLVCGIC